MGPISQPIRRVAPAVGAGVLTLPAAAIPRYLFVDVLRGIAVLMMLETHVTNALLRDDLRETVAYGLLNFVNGLVAPAFLFLAGFNFTLAAERNWAGYGTLGAPFRSQLRRLGTLLVIGYALHLPFLSLLRTLELSGTSQVATFLQSDVLQAIALSLAIPLVILPLTRDRRTVGLVSLGLAIAIAFATPLVWAADLGGLPLPLATLFTPALGSPFPLLPWTSFVLCGVVAGAIFLDVRRTGDEMRLTATIANVFCAGLALVLAGPVLDSHIVDLYPSSAFDGGTPGFFAIRLGLVLMAFAALALSMGATRAGSSTLRLLQVVGQQSLLIYCLGLFLLFGWVLDVPRLAQVVGHTLGFIECLALFAALSAVTVAVGCSWHMYSRSFRAQARAIQYAIAGIFVWLFLIRPY